jgi:hypothetical protein
MTRSTLHRAPDQAHDDGQLGATPDQPTLAAAGESLYAEIHWHLAEVTAALRDQPTPLRPELLRIVLRGLADQCRLLYERGHETPTQPPSLFRDNPVVAEALAMWEGRVRLASTEQRHHTAAHNDGSPQA